MVPWILLGRAKTPDGQSEMKLMRRGDEFVIRVQGHELMNSRTHGSEEILAELSCANLPDKLSPRVLIGGLGMGFTLAAANRVLPEKAIIEVAELVEEVALWNRGPLGPLAGHPLDDKRVRLHIEDVRVVLKPAQARFDAVILDIDNGPTQLTQVSNQGLYGKKGLSTIATALKPGGTLSVWSAQPDERFTERLQECGFSVTVEQVRARAGAGSTHTIWLAVNPLSS
jgi:spermidine synthase